MDNSTDAVDKLEEAKDIDENTSLINALDLFGGLSLYVNDSEAGFTVPLHDPAEIPLTVTSLEPTLISDSMLQSSVQVPNNLTSSFHISNQRRSIHSTILKSTTISGSTIQNCLIIDSALNASQTGNISVSCVSSIEITTTSVMTNVNLEDTYISNCVIKSCDLNGSYIQSAVFHDIKVSLPNQGSIIMDHGIIIDSSSALSGSVKPRSKQEEYISQHSQNISSRTDDVRENNHSIYTDSVAETYATPSYGCDSLCSPSIGLSKPERKRRRNPSDSMRKFKRQTEPNLRELGITRIILAKIQECTYKNRTLSEASASLVQTIGDFMIAENCRQDLSAHVKRWKQISTNGLHALGLPLLENTTEAAARYFIILRDKAHSTQSLEIRIAQASFYVLYLHVCQKIRCKKGEDSSDIFKGAKVATAARAIILEQAAAISSEDSGIHQGKNATHLNEALRWGKRWWISASCLGLGILISCSGEFAVKIRDENFTTTQLNTLFTYMQCARPGSTSFFRSLDFVTKALMFGEASALEDALSDESTGAFGRIALEEAHNTDEESLSHQNHNSPWEMLDADEVAKHAAMSFF